MSFYKYKFKSSLKKITTENDFYIKFLNIYLKTNKQMKYDKKKVSKFREYSYHNNVFNNI